MKYAIIPLLKFLWAVILTVFFTLGIGIIILLKFIWTFKLKYKLPKMELDRLDDHNWSPYYRWGAGVYSIKFKSVFHYIWGLIE